MADDNCRDIIVVEHKIEKDHGGHDHGENCGHTAFVHADKHGRTHIDYVHNDPKTGEVHLHHKCEKGEDHYHECSLDDFHDAASGGELVTGCNNANSAPPCFDHFETNDICGTKNCDHQPVPHNGPNGLHNDYLVPGISITIIGDTDADDKVIELLEVHCPHDDHCDVRGYVAKTPAPPAP